MATDFSALVTALNPFCRFRADNTTTVSFKVTEWTDMSSVNAGHKLTQATAGKQLAGPIGTSSLINNRELAVFTGAQQYDSNLSAASWNFWHQDHARAMYYVGVSQVNGGYCNHFGTKNGGSTAGTFYFTDPTGIGTIDIGSATTPSPGDNALPLPSAFANNAPFWVNYQSDTTLSPDVQFRALGKTTQTANYTITLSTTAPNSTLYLGNSADPFSISELIIFDRVPSTADHNAVLAYIAWRYNLVTGVNPGDVLAIQAGITTAATGSLKIPGTVAAAQSGLTVVATGAETLPGTVAAVQAGLVLSAVQATSIAGTVAASQSGLTVAATGAETLPGTVAAVQAGLTVFAASASVNFGTVAAAQSGLTVAATGTEVIAGTAGTVVALDLTANQPPSSVASTPLVMQGLGGSFTFTFTPSIASATKYAGPAGSNEDLFMFSSGHRITLQGSGGLALLTVWAAAGIWQSAQNLAWSAGQPVTLSIDPTTASVTISGATTGNGTFSTVGVLPPWTWPAGELLIGQGFSGINPFTGAISNVSISGGGAAQAGLIVSATGGPLAINGSAAIVLPGLVVLANPPAPPAAPASGAFVGSGYTAPTTF